ncbi:hypothetical protein BVC71_14055 [Marivivens niveibacter]|uniref:AMP-dependent synthetase/ligase domain-containing protein n=1 Tax=Marivivens niveibacter TaxID=1930667 RepID=A0A251WV64_9RHOB|nr:AMP-binding protein [Marivivens niveibacter]OUD08292.1 hypothetical protein BVC71_14055 [Marivivens niveibacter]
MEQMTSLPCLRPSRTSRLLHCGSAIDHPYVERSTGGRVTTIRPTPVRPSLLRILECLWSGAPFCVTNGADVDYDDDPDVIHSQSSGSTGAPKRIRRHASSWTASFEQNKDLFGITSSDRSVILGSLDSSLSLYALCEGLHQGITVDVVSGEKPAVQKTALQDATILYATPTQARVALNQPFQNLRVIAIGGGHLDDKTRAAIKQNAPNARVVEFYGAAETSFVTMSDDNTPAGSVGSPYPFVQIEIRNADKNGIGEVWVKSPYLFDGYASPELGQTRTDGSWVTVGEIGALRDGYLYLMGRSDRMFTVADRNYFPEPSEAKLATILGVDHIAILPRSNDIRGAVPIILYQGDIAPDQMQDAARQLLNADAPKKAFRLSTFPLTLSGKPDIAALRGMVDRL